MVALSRKDWEPGVVADDYFYQMKLDNDRTQAPLRMVCAFLIAQLTTSVHTYIKEWLAMRKQERVC